MWIIYENFKKLPQVNNQPLGGNSPNLVHSGPLTFKSSDEKNNIFHFRSRSSKRLRRLAIIQTFIGADCIHCEEQGPVLTILLANFAKFSAKKWRFS
jgi:hypothetical protein